MTRKNGSQRRNRREFKVVARGFHKARRDIEKLQHASLDYFNANLERLAQEERERLLHEDGDNAPSTAQPTGERDAGN